jgi:hypothetical protein
MTKYEVFLNVILREMALELVLVYDRRILSIGYLPISSTNFVRPGRLPCRP